MKAESARQIQELIDLEKFNPETLCSGESWMAPSASEVCVVRALIPLTDIQLANRLDVDERTIRKWKSGETRMVFATWCCLCWLARLGMLLEVPALPVPDSSPDTSENETAIVSPVSFPDMKKVVKIGQKPG